MLATNENNTEVRIVEDTILPLDNQMEIDNCEVQMEKKRGGKLIQEGQKMQIHL